MTVVPDIGAVSSRAEAQPGGAEARLREHLRGLVLVCQGIWDPLQHLHGLTKTCLPLAIAVARRHEGAVPSSSPSFRPHEQDAGPADADRPELTEEQSRLVAAALAWFACSSGAEPVGHRTALGNRASAREAVAIRIAAVVRLAHGLLPFWGQDSDVRLEPVGRCALDLVVVRAARTVAGAAEVALSTGLWNRVCLCRIRAWRCVAWSADPQVAAATANTVADVARRAIRRQAAYLLSRLYALGYEPDPEFVHEMRVASRRLRTALRAFARAFNPAVTRRYRELLRLSQRLGETRDLDVYTMFLRAYAVGLEPAHQQYVDYLIRDTGVAGRRTRHALMTAVGRRTGRVLWRQFQEAMALPPSDPRWGQRPISAAAPALLKRCYRRVYACDQPLRGLPAADLHRLRIACKKARYMSEFLAEAYPPEFRKQLIRPLQEVQGALGDVHDADLYEQRVVSSWARVQATASGGHAVGGLQEAQDALLAYIRAWRAASLAKAARLWRSYTSNRRRQEIRSKIASPLEDGAATPAWPAPRPARHRR